MRYGIHFWLIIVLIDPLYGEESADPALDSLRSLARPLSTPHELDPLIDRIGSARLVLLGEASHGTAEFYTWRAVITRRLLSEQDFNFVVVEGDWATLYRLNRYVKGWAAESDSARGIMRHFDRWPTWMWANEETVELIEWLREFNRERAEDAKVGIYGMDVYGEAQSLQKVLSRLQDLDEELAAAAVQAYSCFDPFAGSFHDYARAVAWGADSCAPAVIHLLEQLREAAPLFEGTADHDFFSVIMNAKVVKNAEAHFRLMAQQGPASWNARVDHFYAVTIRLLERYGEGSRGVVWAHNTHIGDARFTVAGQRGERNIGQLARQGIGEEQVVAVGFGTHRGTVQAGRAWGAHMETMTVPPAGAGSLEDVMHRLEMPAALFIFDRPELVRPLMNVLGHRAIGVIYHPEREFPGNYVPTILPRRYDAFIFIDETRALTPLSR